MINTVRWVLTIPSAIAGFFFALMLAIVCHSAAVSFCPESQIISGLCTAPYMKIVDGFAEVLFPTIAAILVVWLPYFCAPKHKHIVVVSCYIVGSIVAFGLALSTQLWVTLFSVITSAGLLTYVLLRIQKYS